MKIHAKKDLSRQIMLDIKHPKFNTKWNKEEPEHPTVGHVLNLQIRKATDRATGYETTGNITNWLYTPMSHGQTGILRLVKLNRTNVGPAGTCGTRNSSIGFGESWKKKSHWEETQVPIINQTRTRSPPGRRGRGRPWKHLERHKHKPWAQREGTDMETAGDEWPSRPEKKGQDRSPVARFTSTKA